METLGITYIWGHSPIWNRVIAARPEIVVLNFANGVGERPDSAYQALVRRLQAAGIRVLGYVVLYYGARPKENAINEANQWFKWYGVDGIFLDNAPFGPLNYLRAINGFVVGPKKSRMSVFNAGATGDITSGKLYTAMLVLPSSKWVVFENTGEVYMNFKTPRFFKGRQVHLLHTVTDYLQFLKLCSSGVGYGFATRDDLSEDNPWDTWPDEFYPPK